MTSFYPKKRRISKKVIKTNLENVKKGLPLTMPLRNLDGVFKKKYYGTYDYRKDLRKKKND